LNTSFELASSAQARVAKAAGEALCAHLTKHVPGVTAVTARLPRMLTDQTNGLTPIDVASTVEVMRPLVDLVQLG
jgi:hypothetical protein